MKDDSTELPGVFNDLDVGIIVHDPESGAILDANEAVSQLYGYTVDEIRSMEIGDLTATSARFSHSKGIQRVREAAAGEPQFFEWQIERSNGELLWVDVHLTKTTVRERTHVLAEVYDITEIKARERRLRLLSRVIRHNLRNEMTVLQGYADRLKRAVEEERLERQAETIFEIATEVGDLSDSINQIEEIAHPDATQRSPTELGDVVRSIVDDARSEYPAAEVSADLSRPVWVTADRGIRYAIEHAVENAIVHNDNESPTVEVEVRDRLDENQGVVRIADDGPTIPDVEIDVLDNDVESTSTYHGSGVGLWVIKWCIDSLGGTLAFEENAPRGNVVTILLPKTEQPDCETASTC